MHLRNALLRTEDVKDLSTSSCPPLVKGCPQGVNPSSSPVLCICQNGSQALDRKQEVHRAARGRQNSPVSW